MTLVQDPDMFEKGLQELLHGENKLPVELITMENLEYFQPLLPDTFTIGGGNVALGAVDGEGYACGTVICAFTGDAYRLEWIFVDPSMRKRGIGKALVYAALRGICKMGENVPVVCYFPVVDGESDLYGFFIRFESAEVLYCHEQYNLKIEDLKASWILNRKGKPRYPQTLFFDKSKEEQLRILALLQKEAYYRIDNYEEWKASCIPEYCRMIERDGELTNLIFVRHGFGKELEVSFLYSTNEQGMMEMLTMLTMEVEDRFPDAVISFDTPNAETERMAKKLFPDAQPSHIYEVSW